MPIMIDDTALATAGTAHELQVLFFNKEAQNHTIWNKLADNAFNDLLSAQATSLEFYLIPPTGDRTVDVNLNEDAVLGPRPVRTRDWIPQPAGGGAPTIPAVTAVSGTTCGNQAASSTARFAYSAIRQFGGDSGPGNRTALYAIAGAVPTPASGKWSVVVSLPVTKYPFAEGEGDFSFAVAARWTQQRADRPPSQRSAVMEGGDLLPTQGHFVQGSISAGSGTAQQTLGTVLPGEVVCAVLEDEYAVQQYMVRNVTSRVQSVSPPPAQGLLRNTVFKAENLALAGFAPVGQTEFTVQGTVFNWQNQTVAGTPYGDQGYQTIQLDDNFVESYSEEEYGQDDNFVESYAEEEDGQADNFVLTYSETLGATVTANFLGLATPAATFEPRSVIVTMPTLLEAAYYAGSTASGWPIDWTTTGPFFDISVESVEVTKFPNIYDSENGATTFVGMELDTVAAGDRNLTWDQDFKVFEVVHRDPFYWKTSIKFSNVVDNTGMMHNDPYQTFDVFMVAATSFTPAPPANPTTVTPPTGVAAVAHNFMPLGQVNTIVQPDDDQMNFYNNRWFQYNPTSPGSSYTIPPLAGTAVELLDNRMPAIPERMFLYVRSKPIVSARSQGGAVPTNTAGIS